MKTYLIIQFSFEGLHYWPDCPDDHSESYLKNKHRHVFTVQVKFPVQGLNRQVEFIQLKRMMLDRITKKFETNDPLPTSMAILDMGAMSCEMIAHWIMEEFRDITYCRVLEDGENGAEVLRHDTN